MRKQNNLMVLLACMALANPCLAASKRQEVVSALDEIAAQSGLVRTTKKNIDLAYKRPDATLSKYSKLRVMPISVHFSKNFDAGRGSPLYTMHPPDLEEIKTGIAKIFAEVFQEELHKGGYQVVNEIGPDVLEVNAAIVNLYIVAPDNSMQTAARSRIYTTDSGEMTLVMELRDSLSGALLAQIYDRHAATSTTWQWTNSVTNIGEARQIIRRWATELRKAFDVSRAPD